MHLIVQLNTQLDVAIVIMVIQYLQQHVKRKYYAL